MFEINNSEFAILHSPLTTQPTFVSINFIQQLHLISNQRRAQGHKVYMLFSGFLLKEEGKCRREKELKFSYTHKNVTIYLREKYKVARTKIFRKLGRACAYRKRGEIMCFKNI